MNGPQETLGYLAAQQNAAYNRGYSFGDAFSYASELRNNYGLMNSASAPETSLTVLHGPMTDAVVELIQRRTLERQRAEYARMVKAGTAMTCHRVQRKEST